MNINKDKLEQVLRDTIKATKRGIFESEETCIGVLNGMQVFVKVTKDESEFMDEPHADFICIED